MACLIASLLVLGHVLVASGSELEDSLDSLTSVPETDSAPSQSAFSTNLAPQDNSGSGAPSYSIEDMLSQSNPTPAPTIRDPVDAMLGPLPSPSGSSYSNPSPSPYPSASGEDAMAALLNGDVGTVGSDDGGAGSNGFSMRHVNLPAFSRDVVSGIIESFMHKVTLNPGEKQCLEDSLASFTGDIVAIVRDIVNAVKGFLRPNGKGLQANSAGIASLMPMAMDAIGRVTDLVTQSTSLVKSCVQGDALRLLNRTAHNLINFKYVERRLLVNGVNIAEALAQAIIDFEHHDGRGFGQQIGLALRKVVLSTANNGIKLPEGTPEDKLIADASEGIFAGFFAPGVAVHIKDKADPNVNIEIDLHACIAGNHAFYRDIWESLWTLFAQMAANKDQHMAFGENGEQPVWMNELLMAVMRLPMAFEKCGMDPEMESMMLEAFKTFKELSVTLDFPDDRIKADSATEKVALAVKYFGQWKFKDFGKELGKLFRELLLLALPTKYSVDDTGRLRRNLVNEAEVFNAKRAEQEADSGRATFVLLGMAFVLLMSLVALKRLRVPVSWSQSNSAYLDVEAGDDEELETLE